MWEMYNELMEKLPENCHILEIIQIKRRVYVKSESGYGSAMTFNETVIETNQFIGQKVKKIAPLIKSWDFNLASMALAAMNSVFNNQKQINKLENYSISQHDIFSEYANPTSRKIATVGYFRYIDRYPDLADCVTVLELKAISGTFPASASEFILPNMDVVFITGSTLVNKTLPRLLTLSKNATTILVGGTVPLTPILFNYGIDIISTKLIDKWPPVREGSKMTGQSINIKNKGEFL